MRWYVKYNYNDLWDLNFPPQFMDERGEFSELDSMADVLAWAIEAWIVNQ